MATGVKPRDEEISFTRTDLEAIEDAMKTKKFRDLLNEYCEEVRDPANQELYQKEMTQLEKERGFDVTFINPKGGYVIKTSVAGDRKAFINICSNENVGKPSCNVQEVNGQKGMNWQIPYSMIPPREDYNQKREKCVIYDVVFHPDTLRMAEVNKQFRELVNKTAFEGLQKTYDIHLDSNNCRFPKSYYKGMTIPAVIRKEDPDFKPSEDDDEKKQEFSPEIMEKLFPQRIYPQKTTEPPKDAQAQAPQPKRKARKDRKEFTHLSDNGYTLPKYLIKQQKTVDFQDYTYRKDSKQFSAIPTHIIVEINLPLLSTSKDCILDVQERSLALTSENPAKYKLNITLPYSVNDDCGSAKFDKTKRMLIVTLPVIKKNCASSDTNYLRVDSGVDTEDNSGSQSDEENPKDNLIKELSSKPAEPSVMEPAQTENSYTNGESFLDSSLGYMLPSYTHNVLEDIIAFTFHVKNTEPDSVKVKKDGNKIFFKFTSVGSGFVPVYYAAVIIFDEGVNFENVTGEAWDNNVILQMELVGEVPQKFQIGLSNDSMTTEYFDISQIKKTSKSEISTNSAEIQEECQLPVVEVTNLGTETNIVVSSNNTEYDEDDIESPTGEGVVWTDSGSYENGAKSILRKPMTMIRSYSESSVGDIASSMDYISSDCIPEESSLKKTVRFSDVIARQFYRYNSSIEGQKKKNQRKKSKKRNLERQKSESEAEDDIFFSSKTYKPRLKSVLKQRRDSGLADTSDAEADYKNSPSEFECYDTRNDEGQQSNGNGNNSVFDYEEQDFNENNSNVKNHDKNYDHVKDKNTSENNNEDTHSKRNCGLCENDDVDVSNENHKTSANDDDDDNGLNESVLNIVSKKDDSAPAIWESETSAPKNSKKVVDNTDDPETITCDNIKHNTNLYNPDRLNKGQYLEVTFKNDLIFDLDM